MNKSQLIVRTEDRMPEELLVVLKKGPRKTRVKSLKGGDVRSIETRYINVDFYCAYHELEVLEATHLSIVKTWVGGFNSSNFHIQTECDWLPLETAPDRPADFVSPSGSAYWYVETGVIRKSDHWLPYVASCDWSLGGQYVKGKELVGFAEWNQFTINPRFKESRAKEAAESMVILSKLESLLNRQ